MTSIESDLASITKKRLHNQRPEQFGGKTITALAALLKAIVLINDRILTIGKSIAWVMLALMVLVILAQVFFRYVINNALPWPDEAARFCMLWMTGIVAPLAYRHGGFVAIEMLLQGAGAALARFIAVVLLSISLTVLIIAIYYGWKHTMGFGGNFDSSSLKLPLHWIGFEEIRVKLRYMYGSLLLCVVLMTSVNLELLIRNLILLIDPDRDLQQPTPLEISAAGAD